MIKNNIPNNCPICESRNLFLKYNYNSRPEGETLFNVFSDNYDRSYWECKSCGHFISSVELDLDKFYAEGYSDSTYKSREGIHKIFQKIKQLPDDKSDNKQRVKWIDLLLKQYSSLQPSEIHILDVGSGIGVFPFEIKSAGYKITASDPDKNAFDHMKYDLKLDAIHGHFQKINQDQRYDLLTFNKVLEHVKEPLAMLMDAKGYLKDNGFIYLELPDASGASRVGQFREEFFIEHLHVFTLKSTMELGVRAGLKLLFLQILKEPSSKFTIRSFWQNE
jgi:2-polyprenyl-3-methyl-5-hydroxy-6-metoxy-1,4-benzoquinol methylase